MLNNNIKYCRESLEMTQSEFGAIFGVSDGAVRSWESARDPIPLSKLIAFCNIYNFSMDFICGLANRKERLFELKADKSLIGKRLQEFRNNLGITQQKLADKCKIPQTTYSGYETGSSLITTSNLYYICKTFNISMDSICKK